eukprot:gene15932-18197_t
MSYWDEKHSEGKDEFQKACMDVGHKITSKGAHFIMCCVDGSRQSDIAFESALNLRRKFDHINVYHAYKDIPDLQPATWRHKALETKFDCELVSKVPASLYSLTFVDRCGNTVNDVLHQAVDPIHFTPDSTQRSPLSGPPDFIIMGHHGRKGPKERRASIGSTADHALRNLHYPCMIVKNLVPAGERSYLMAVNGSNVSKRGFDILMRLVNPRDTVQLVYFAYSYNHDLTNAEEKDHITDYYTKELREIGPVNSEFKIVEYAANMDLAHSIVEYANESSADVFAIAPRATRNPSSITEHILTNVLLTVLLCKN